MLWLGLWCLAPLSDKM